MDICVYYDEKSGHIIDITPIEIDPATRSRLEELWNHPISRKILIEISAGVPRLPDIQKKIGHSASTLHEALQKLVHADLVRVEMSYEGNKHKILKSNVLCVTKSTSNKLALQKFFQGLWVDSEKTKRIIDTMEKKPHHWWTPEELSAMTKIPIEHITLLLSNFDSQTTRALSQFLKEPPFEKKVSYRFKK